MRVKEIFSPHLIYESKRITSAYLCLLWDLNPLAPAAVLHRPSIVQIELAVVSRTWTMEQYRNLCFAL